MSLEGSIWIAFLGIVDMGYTIYRKMNLFFLTMESTCTVSASFFAESSVVELLTALSKRRKLCDILALIVFSLAVLLFVELTNGRKLHIEHDEYRRSVSLLSYQIQYKNSIIT
jgi:hypothetical protein